MIKNIYIVDVLVAVVVFLKTPYYRTDARHYGIYLLNNKSNLYTLFQFLYIKA